MVFVLLQPEVRGSLPAAQVGGSPHSKPPGEKPPDPAVLVRGSVVTAQDLELNCDIRNVLARHAIDLTKTNFFARRGHVHLSGQVSVVGANRPSEDTAGALKASEAELRRLREVKSLSFEFTNWVRDDNGVWICLEREPPPAPTPG